VIRGDGRGRGLGFPTANISPAPDLLIPKAGVYHGAVIKEGERHAAVINVGVKPTFGPDSPVGVEAHMLAHEEDLYGHEIAVRFESRIRGEERFASVEALVAQVNRDIETARQRESERA